MADSLRRHVIELLRGGQAHITFAEAVREFPVEKAGLRPAGAPHSAWELLEHMRIAQDDIVRFSGAYDVAPRNPASRALPEGYIALDWPNGYWPPAPAPRESAEWDRSVAAVHEDLETFLRLISDPERDLLAPFPWGDGQTLLREALLIADHGAYHLGQLMLLRRMIA